MTLVRLAEKEEMPPDVQKVFESGEQQYGQILNTWRAIALNPAIFQAYLPYIRSIFAPAALDQRIKEMCALRVAILNHCRYTVSHRASSAKRNGIPDADILGLLDPPNHTYSEAEQVALAFTEELTVQVDDIRYAANKQGVSDKTLTALKQHFSDTAISELAVSVSLWNALSRFHRVMDLELDMPPPPPELDAAL